MLDGNPASFPISPVFDYHLPDAPPPPEEPPPKLELEDDFELDRREMV